MADMEEIDQLLREYKSKLASKMNSYLSEQGLTLADFEGTLAEKALRLVRNRGANEIVAEYDDTGSLQSARQKADYFVALFYSKLKSVLIAPKPSAPPAGRGKRGGNREVDEKSAVAFVRNLISSGVTDRHQLMGAIRSQKPAVRLLLIQALVKVYRGRHVSFESILFSSSDNEIQPLMEKLLVELTGGQVIWPAEGRGKHCPKCGLSK